MIWWYEKVEETEELIIYRYARESKDLDGEIVYDKRSEEWKLTVRCTNDKESDWNASISEEKFRHVVKEGFPDRRTVAIG